MVLIQILIIGWISDLLARIAVAFACWNFFIVFKLNNQKKRGGGAKASAIPVCWQTNLSTMLAFFFFAKNSEVE